MPSVITTFADADVAGLGGGGGGACSRGAASSVAAAAAEGSLGIV